MDTKDFLRRVLPETGGDYYGIQMVGKKDGRQYKATSIDDLAQWVAKHRTNKNVYFATGVYDGRRTIDKAKLKRALYLDLDVGVSEPDMPPKYGTKKEAVTELMEFCRKHFLPPTFLVDSGGGIHAYWAFEQPVPIPRWQQLADALKQLVRDRELKTDPSVTADAARVLRAPNTINMNKSITHPVASRILYSAPTNYPVEEIANKLQVARAPVSLSLAVSNDDLSDGVEVRSQIWRASKMIPACPMFADAYATGGAGLSETLWMQQLNVLAFCEDGADFVHPISDKHTTYTHPNTQQKWNQRLRSKERVGPTRCETFAQWSSHCEGCPHRGTITTPLQLGGERDATLPKPYNQDDHGVYFLGTTQDEDGNTVPHRVSVFQYRVTDFSVVYADGRTHMQFTAHANDGTKVVELDLADISDRKACTKTLAGCHVVLGYHEYNHFRDFMNTWVKRMQDAKQAQKAWSQLGWTSNPKGFALAEEVLLADGRRIKNLSPDRVLHGLYKPTGAIEPWKKAAALLLANDRFAAAMVLGTAFGAPLSPWVRDPSAMMSFVSKGSGTGKTTALEVAQAVWGHPKKAMFQLDDTQNSVYRKLSFANNLPGYWDELRTKDDTARLGRMLFHLTGGRDKARLTQSVDLRDAGTWSTILTVASNESIADIANQHSVDTEAGRARVFELIMPPLGDERTAELDALMLELGDNYGVVGQQYAEFLVRNEDACRAIMAATVKRLAKKLGTLSSERFWLSSVSKALCGLMFATKCDLLKLDLAKFEKYACEAFMLQRGNMVENYGSAAEQSNDVLMDFISANMQQFTVYDHLPAPRQPPGRTYAVPRVGEVVGSVGLLSAKLRVARRSFKAWLFKEGRGTPSMVLLNIPYQQVTARLLAEGVGPLLKCYEFDLTPDITGAIEDFTAFEEQATSSDASPTEDPSSETDPAGH